MESSNNNSVILFNGEIYNYKEIRNKLKKYNIIPKSSGDTEVLLHWLDLYGTSGSIK